MNAKLTLTIEGKAIDSAKKYARKKGISLSGIIENYLRSITAEEADEVKLSPKVKRLIGVIELPEDYNYKKDIGDTLVDKYSEHIWIILPQA